MPELARTPQPPYYAAIFSSLRTEGGQGYGEMAARMMELTAQQPGFLGVESTRGADGLGITVSYREELAAITQRSGHEDWYKNFSVRIARVERQYMLD